MASTSTRAATPKPAGPVARRTRSKSDLAAELHAAADSGDVNRVRQLLQAGAAVNGPLDPQGLTALHLAAAAGHPDVVQELLAKGADVTASHTSYGTPLFAALFTPAAAQDSDRAAAELSVAAVLLKAGADIFGPSLWSGRTVAQVSAARGNSVSLQRLLAAGCNINQQSACGHTLLKLAVRSENEEAVRMLLAHGAAVGVADGQGWTALFHAAVLKNTAVVQLLLAAGAAATAVSKSGQTVLHCLAQFAAGPSTAAVCAPQALRDIVQLLINRGAHVNARNPSGWTPLHIAAVSNNPAAAAVLLEYGADVNAVDNYGWSSLWAAAGAAHGDVVQMLLDAGADIGGALNSAVHAKDRSIIKQLLQHKSHPPSLDAVVDGFVCAMYQQADFGGILATLLLHFCLLAQEQRALSPSAAVRYLFSRPSVAAAAAYKQAAYNQDRPVLSLALLRSWGEHTTEVDAAQEKDLAAVKRAAQQAYLQLAAADRAASSAPQPAATPAAAATGAAAVTSAAASRAAPAAVEPAAAPRRSARLRTRMAATTAAAPKLPAAKRWVR